MPAHASPVTVNPDGSYRTVDQGWGPGECPGAVVTRNANHQITDVDLDGAEQYQARQEAQKGFDDAELTSGLRIQGQASAAAYMGEDGLTYQESQASGSGAAPTVFDWLAE